MQKTQILLVGAATVVLIALVAFGRTVPKYSDKQAMPTAAHMHDGQEGKTIAFGELLATAKQNVPAEKLMYLARLENIVRGDVKNQQIAAYKQLYASWDSLNQLPIAAHYLGEAAKLENSEKSLTFAANLFLEHLEHAEDPAVMNWETKEAIALLDQAITLSPGNDSLKIKQALLYMNTEPMVGVQKLRDVVASNPDNAEAQITLANLAIQSNQYDKAIERMESFTQKHPDEAKAVFVLAEAYRGKGDVKKAVELLEKCKSMLTDPSLKAELDNYIKSIK